MILDLRLFEDCLYSIAPRINAAILADTLIGEDSSLTGERGGPPINGPPKREGFGSLLTRLAVSGQLGGKLSHEWNQEGLTVHLSAPLDRLVN
jgi:hypothetical protein